uniref:Uncharacterized protein n=1 Tax=Picea glauca TaxID=3330 RepID=A0A101LUZ3_PICGL|nr:hypothetical protein ABT39_MTgene2364 [Picea glauca]QHR92256.1 hypothetical protein Q903MT_gene6295 [Picea sitchensis]
MYACHMPYILIDLNIRGKMGLAICSDKTSTGLSFLYLDRTLIHIREKASGRPIPLGMGMYQRYSE